MLLLVAMACPWKFKISGNCVLEPSFRRVYGAPFDTTIKAAPLRPGDLVDPGQTVVEFDREEVEAQLREARSKRVAAEKEMMTYLTEQKVSQYAEAQARCDALAAQVELLERHLARTTVKADFAGMIVSGDLKQDIGRTVRLGQELIELAPLNELLLQVEVEQGDVVYVKEGQGGQFTAKARPGVAMPFVVARVHPTPEVRKGESVYVIEGTVANTDGWLRPGMEGAAKITVGWRNITWVATRKVLNWLRLRLWW
jgi:multidrug efflux pump subunit AcrA (membrane-fusion protein)